MMLIVRKPTLLFAVAVVIFLTFVLPPITYHAQQNTGPISKKSLLEALGKKVLSSKELIREVQRSGVAFQLNSVDEQEIRQVGKYLGKKGLDNFVDVVRSNYRTNAPQQSTPTPGSSSINQTMNNSPGGIQAGGNVTINQGIQPRRLTAEQEAQFVKIVKDNPKGNIEISCIESGGPEPCDFARQLARLLESKDAGWAVNFSPLMFGAGDPTKIIPEMYILVHSNKNPPPRAIVLQYALKSVGYDAIGIERSDVEADFVQLTVWFKRQLIEVEKPIPPLRFVEKQIAARSQDAPYGLEVTIQTTRTTQPTRLLIAFTGTVMETDYFIGMASTAGVRPMPDNPMVVEADITMPAFSPQQPFILIVFSKEPIHVKEVKQVY
jgi:hypothetical protein